MTDKRPDIDAVYQVLKGEFKKRRMPVVDLIAIQSRDPYRVLVATILSARTRDATTTDAADRLFARAPDLEALSRLSTGEIDKLIFPVGFHRNKAAFLTRLPAAIRDGFNNRIPDNVEELTTLPGVGRKTANLVVAVAFGKPAICVDVHVHRIMNRLGYVKTGTPLETEMALRKKLPQKYWITINSFLVSFGQHCCFPRNPRCDRCPIFRQCRRRQVTTPFSPETPA